MYSERRERLAQYCEIPASKKGRKNKKQSLKQSEQVEQRVKRKLSEEVQKVKLAHLMKNTQNDDILVQTLNMIAEYNPKSLSVNGDELCINMQLISSNLGEQIEMLINQQSLK